MRSVEEMLRPEAELFLLLLRSHLSESQRGRAVQIGAIGSNWSQFDRLCKRFRLAHVVSHNLRAFDGETIIPADMLRQYDAHFWSAVVRNEFWMLGRELPSAVLALKASGVDAMLLKGPVLAAMNYACPGLRLFGDLDLLVRPDEIGKASEALMKIGYEVPGYRKQLSGNWDEGKTFPPLVRQNSSGQTAMIDLHWRLSEKYDTNEARLWERAKRHKFGDCSVLVPSPEHRLYHLCLHTAQHGFTADVWDGSHLTMQCARDMDAIIRTDGASLDWTELQEMVSLSNVAVHCYSYLKLTEALFEAAVPRHVYENLKRDTGPHIIERNWAVMAKRFLLGRPDDIKRLAFNVLVLRDFKDGAKLKRFLQRCFPSVASVARHYGVSERSPLRYVCYIRRLVRPASLRKGLCLGFRLVQMMVRRALS